MEKLEHIDAFISAIRPLYDEHSGMNEFASGAFWERYRDLGNPIEQLLKAALLKYETVEGLFSPEIGLREKYCELLHTFPSFIFYIAIQLQKSTELRGHSRSLMIAGVSYLVANRLPGKTAIDKFHQSVDSHSDTTTLSGKLFDKEEQGTGYLPKMLFLELYLIGKSFQVIKTSNKLELIENQFITVGILQIFLRYYFHLLEAAQNDDIAEHLEEVFSNFFIALRKQEKQMWTGLNNVDIVKVQVNHIIGQNKEPTFYRDRYAWLNRYFPMLRGKDDHENIVMQEQLKVWQSFTVPRLVLFGNMTLACKGLKSSSFLLNRLAAEDLQQFAALAPYFQEKLAQNKYRELFGVYQRVASAKKKEASKATAKPAPPKEDPNIRPDIRDWGPFLTRFHDQIALSGVLSDGELPEFFKGFSEAALQMLQEKEITPETSKRFKKTLNGLMEQCIARSSLNKQEVKIYQKQIDREITDVEAVDFDDRTEKIDSIGMVLVQARKKQEAYEQIFRESLPIQLTVNYNAERICFSVEDVLLLPLPNRQKERLLETYVPSLISENMMMAIYNIKLSGSDGLEAKASVYDIGKYANLKIAKLISLLEQSQGFKGMKEKELIAIEHNDQTLKVKISDFFRFPLSANKDKADAKHFSQHLNYLKQQTDRNRLPLAHYEIILNHLDEFPQISYTKYFRIFNGKNFDSSAMAAMIDLWRNQGLRSLEA